jgi:hypothetical protein
MWFHRDDPPRTQKYSDDSILYQEALRGSLEVKKCTSVGMSRPMYCCGQEFPLKTRWGPCGRCSLGSLGLTYNIVRLVQALVSGELMLMCTASEVGSVQIVRRNVRQGRVCRWVASVRLVWRNLQQSQSQQSRQQSRQECPYGI